MRVLNRYLYLFDRHLTTVVANNAEIDPRIIDKYLKTENKTIVHLDREKVAAQGVEIIEGDIFSIEEETIRHNAMKTAFLIFSYLMEQQ